MMYKDYKVNIFDPFYTDYGDGVFIRESYITKVIIVSYAQSQILVSEALYYIEKYFKNYYDELKLFYDAFKSHAEYTIRDRIMFKIFGSEHISGLIIVNDNLLIKLIDFYEKFSRVKVKKEVKKLIFNVILVSLEVAIYIQKKLLYSLICLDSDITLKRVRIEYDVR